MFTFFCVLPYDVIRICSVGACANSDQVYWGNNSPVIAALNAAAAHARNSSQVYWGQPSNNSPDDQQLDLLLYYPSNVSASAARMISPQKYF